MDTSLKTAEAVIAEWIASAYAHWTRKVVANEDDLAIAVQLAERGITKAELEDAIEAHEHAPRLAPIAASLLS